MHPLDIIFNRNEYESLTFSIYPSKKYNFFCIFTLFLTKESPQVRPVYIPASNAKACYLRMILLVSWSYKISPLMSAPSSQLWNPESYSALTMARCLEDERVILLRFFHSVDHTTYVISLTTFYTLMTFKFILQVQTYPDLYFNCFHNIPT